MHNRDGIVRNLGVLTGGQIVAQLLTLVALVFLARLLGSHWFGVVQIGVAFSAYALLTAEWGMRSLGIREVARLDRTAAVLRYAQIHQGMLCVQAIAVGAVGLILLPRLPFYHQDQTLFLLYLAMIVPQVFMQDWIGLGLERATWVGIARIGSSLVYALLILLALRPLADLTGWPPYRLVPALLIVAFIGGNILIFIPVTRWLGRPVWPRFAAPREWRRRWRETAPIGASTVTLRILFSIDIIVLGILANPAVAGDYAAAAKVVFLFVIAMEVLWKALLPRLSRLAGESRTGFRRSFNLYLALVLAGLVPAAVGGVLLGPDLISLLYGDRFPAASRVFQILAVSYSLLSVGWFLGNSLIAQDRQAEYFPPLLVSALVALIGCLVLVPRFGSLGASFGMLGGHALLLVSLGVVSRRQLSGALWRPLATIAAATMLLAGVIWMTAGWHPLARIALAASVYVAVMALPVRRWSVRFSEGIVSTAR